MSFEATGPVLVDTSVWVDHFRAGETRLVEQLEEGEVYCHPFVIGEIALGHLKERREILSLLEELPAVEVLGAAEVLHFIEKNDLCGTGLGYVDAHLLGSAVLVDVPLWTKDRRLSRIAARFGVSVNSG